MASKTTSLALFLTLNILFFALVSANKGGSGGSAGSGSTPSTPSGGRGTAACPCDGLGACASLLGGLVNLTLGQPPVAPCCSLFNGLADLDAAGCLCTALKANLLGGNLNIPISLSLLLNACSRNVPRGFQCN